MRLLTVAFVSSEEFLSHYRDREDLGALFVRTRTELEGDQRVLMEISFPGLPNRALVRGSVAKVTPGKGAWVQFNEADRSTLKFLLELARGQVQVTPTVNRSFERFPAELPVDCTIEVQHGERADERLVTRTVDLGAGGVFVRSLTPPAIGTKVKISIGPVADGEFDAVTLEGHVAWVRNGDAKGFGVRFQDKSQPDARTLRTMLRRASESGKIAFA